MVTTTRLEELEAQMTSDVNGWRRFAAGLNEVKEDRLWSPTYQNWDDYCLKRWGRSARYLDMLIMASRVAAILDPQSSIFQCEYDVRARAEQLGLTVPRWLAMIQDGSEVPDHTAVEPDETAEQDQEQTPAYERWKILYDRAFGQARRLRESAIKLGDEEAAKLIEQAEERLKKLTFKPDTAA